MKPYFGWMNDYFDNEEEGNSFECENCFESLEGISPVLQKDIDKILEWEVHYDANGMLIGAVPKVCTYLDTYIFVCKGCGHEN